MGGATGVVVIREGGRDGKMCAVCMPCHSKI